MLLGQATLKVEEEEEEEEKEQKEEEAKKTGGEGGGEGGGMCLIWCSILGLIVCAAWYCAMLRTERTYGDTRMAVLRRRMVPGVWYTMRSTDVAYGATRMERMGLAGGESITALLHAERQVPSSLCDA
eukprot:2958578-Rhodomonas_salina.1